MTAAPGDTGGYTVEDAERDRPGTTITLKLKAVDEDDGICDGLVDEDNVCDQGGGAFEVCNGVDDDLDGQVDEGCPMCRLTGDTCSTDADCCYSACTGGVCTLQCRPAEVSCNSDSDCCSGACSGSASSPGVCLAQ